MSLIEDIKQGLKDGFNPMLNTTIFDGSQGEKVQAETWYRWVNKNTGWRLPKYQTGTVPKSPINFNDISSAFNEYAQKLNQQRTKITGFETGSDETQYLYLNVVDGEKVKVIELKLSIRPTVAVQEALIYHFDDETDETVLAAYIDTLKFAAQTSPVTTTVKRLKRKSDALSKDVVALQVALLNQTKLKQEQEQKQFNASFTEESYVAPVANIEPAAAVANVVNVEPAAAANVANAEPAAAVNVEPAAEEPQPGAMATSTEEQSKQLLQEKADQAAVEDQERFNRETAAKAAAIAAAQAAYDAVLEQHNKEAQSIKDTAAALKKAEDKLSTVKPRHEEWTAKSTPTRMQHFKAQNKTTLNFLRAALIITTVCAIALMAVLVTFDFKWTTILGGCASLLFSPVFLALPFLDFTKPVVGAQLNPNEAAYERALQNKRKADNALVQTNKFDAGLKIAKAALDAANAIVVAPVGVVAAVVEDPLTIQKNPASTHPLQNIYPSMYNFKTMPACNRTNSNSSSGSGETVQPDSATSKPIVYIRKASSVIENPASGLFIKVDLTKEQLEEFSNKFSDEELKALLANSASEVKSMQLNPFTNK